MLVDTYSNIETIKLFGDREEDDRESRDRFEATSALDSEVEAEIQETLYQVMEDKTVIAIAHRLSTIARMDRIVVLDDGCIVEEGRHDELIALGGVYHRLWARQSGGFIGDR